MSPLVTKYLVPTNHRGARMGARYASKRVSVPYQDELDVHGNHLFAAEQLKQIMAAKGGEHWLRPTIAGQLPDGTYAHVFLPPSLIDLQQADHLRGLLAKAVGDGKAPPYRVAMLCLCDPTNLLETRSEFASDEALVAWAMG